MDWINVEAGLPKKGRYYVLVWDCAAKRPSTILAETLKASVRQHPGKYSHWQYVTPPEENE